jgi:hypothetical protein
MQLSKTGRLEKIVGIFESVGIHIVRVVKALYYAARQFYKTVGNRVNRILTGAIATVGTLGILITGNLSILWGFLRAAAVRTAIGATFHRGPCFREQGIRPEILTAHQEQASRQYDCDTFHLEYKYNNFSERMFKT